MIQQINLYHANFRRHTKIFSAQTMLLASVLVMIGTLLLAALNVWQTRHLKQELARVEQQHVLD